MKKTLTISILAILSAGIAFYFLRPDGTPPETAAKKPRKGPAYFEYIREIKGIPPANVHRQWVEQTVFYKNSPQMLDDLEEIGPSNIGGRTRALVLDVEDANRVYAGAISGGLWISENSGRGWQKVNDQEISLNITHLTQNPFNKDILYYTTGEGAGNSSAAPGDGIFKSTDRGRTFTQLPASLNGQFNYTWRICHSLTDSNTIFVATQSSGVYRSTDGGQSFERVLAVVRPVHDLEVFEDGSVMATVQGQGIYRSPDGAANSWVAKNTGLPAANTFGRIEIAYCASQPNQMYAAVSNSNNNELIDLFRSSDTGNTWIQTPVNPGQVGAEFPFTWYCLALHVKHDDPESVIIASVNIYATRNGGSTWNSVRNGHADYHVITMHPDKPSKIYVGNDGGLYEYDWSSLAGSLVNLNYGYNVTQFYAGSYGPQGKTIITGAQDNGTNWSNDGSDTFRSVFGADGSYTHIHQQQNGVAYLSYQNGNIRKTDDFYRTSVSSYDIKNELDGNFDGQIDDGSWFINPFEMNYRDGEQLFFPTRKRLFRSTSGGVIWEAVTGNLSGGEAFSVGIGHENNPTVYVGGSNGLFYRINNVLTAQPGSEKNLKLRSPSSIRTSFIGSVKVNPLDSSEVFIGLTNYSTVSRIWRINKADSDTPVWTDISGNLPSNLPVNWIEVDPWNPDSNIYIATDFGLYYTDDGGTNWYKDPTVPNVVVDMLRLRLSDRRLFIYTHGRGAWTARLFPVGNWTPGNPGNPSSVDEDKNLTVQVYPNPASDYIRIKWGDPSRAERLVEVYDLSGKRVFRGKISSDDQIDMKGWKAGTYILSGEGLKARKIIKTS